MKKFIEKLISMLKSKHIPYLGMDNSVPYGTEMIKLFDAIKIINQLSEEYNNGWIPCSEKLPEEKGTYLVTVKNFGVTFARFTGQKDNMHFDSNVIAWQPLPAPYQKGE